MAVELDSRLHEGLQVDNINALEKSFRIGDPPSRSR